MMRSKLLQKQNYGLNQSRKVVDVQQENIEDSSLPWRRHERSPNPVHHPVDSQARTDFPGLLERGWRPARS
jgi:hypothetical protein